MTIAIRYYSKSGNSKKLADAISEALGVPALSVDQKLTENVDLLFLCSAVYWAGIDAQVKSFLADPGAKIGKLANVSNAALVESNYGQIKKLSAASAIPLAEKEYHCKGSFAAMHKGKPDAADLDRVKAFAQELAAER